MLLTELQNFKTKLQYHHNLNPALWDGDKLKDDVRDKLREIAEKFIEYLDVKKSDVLDIIFTGSNTNYNWTSLSDIDLHIILNMNDLESNGIDAKKSLWNDEHDISINGFSVELYAESKTSNQSGNAGLYSIKKDKWIREPKFENIKFDYDKIKKKTSNWMKQIDKLVDSKSKDLKKLNNIKEKIKSSRHADLAKGGEFSLENLVFKALRNNGYLDKLFSYIRALEDENLSLNK